eukprot:1102295-Amphidinium_carterae.1
MLHHTQVRTHNEGSSWQVGLHDRNYHFQPEPGPLVKPVTKFPEKRALLCIRSVRSAPILGAAPWDMPDLWTETHPMATE